jgi:hypothetical protein
MTYLALGLAVLLFLLAHNLRPFALLALILLTPWRDSGGGRGGFLWPAAMLLALGLYPVTLLDIAAVALVLWAALH